VSGSAIQNEQFERNINIPTLCGANGTRNDTCPNDRGICSINPLANNFWTSEAYCVCKPGYYGNNCQFGPLCNDTTECSGRGTCGVHKLTNNTFVEKCVCESGYFGDTCSNNPCFNVTCQNSGTCSGVSIPDGTYSWYCKCPDTYFGNKCQYEKDQFGLDNRIANAAAPTPSLSTLCQAKVGYTLYGGSYCYRLESINRKNWDDAKAACESEGTHLVIINSQDEFNILKSLIVTDYDYWVIKR
jgi:hypothetical protein